MSRILLRHFYSPIDISRDDFSPRFVKLRHIDCRFLWKKNFCLNVAEEVERNERYVKRSGLRNFVADLIRNTSSFEPIKKKKARRYVRSCEIYRVLREKTRRFKDSPSFHNTLHKHVRGRTMARVFEHLSLKISTNVPRPYSCASVSIDIKINCTKELVKAKRNIF